MILTTQEPRQKGHCKLIVVLSQYQHYHKSSKVQLLAARTQNLDISIHRLCHKMPCAMPGPLEEWSFGILEHWKMGKLADWDIGKLESWNMGPLECWTIGRLCHWNIRTLELWSSLYHIHACVSMSQYVHYVPNQASVSLCLDLISSIVCRLTRTLSTSIACVNAGVPWWWSRPVSWATARLHHCTVPMLVSHASVRPDLISSIVCGGWLGPCQPLSFAITPLCVHSDHHRLHSNGQVVQYSTRIQQGASKQCLWTTFTLLSEPEHWKWEFLIQIKPP